MRGCMRSIDAVDKSGCICAELVSFASAVPDLLQLVLVDSQR